MRRLILLFILAEILWGCENKYDELDQIMTYRGVQEMITSNSNVLAASLDDYCPGYRQDSNGVHIDLYYGENRYEEKMFVSIPRETRGLYVCTFYSPYPAIGTVYNEIDRYNKILKDNGSDTEIIEYYSKVMLLDKFGLTTYLVDTYKEEYKIEIDYSVIDGINDYLDTTNYEVFINIGITVYEGDKYVVILVINSENEYTLVRVGASGYEELVTIG